MAEFNPNLNVIDDGMDGIYSVQSFFSDEVSRVMSHIPDLQTLKFGDVAIGWLHPEHAFCQADPAADFLARLKEFAKRSIESAVALGFGAAGGFHTCEFCGRANGTANFGVPAGDRLFICPEMIPHYVEVHRYSPPTEFITAVLTSPLPGTREYVKSVAPFVERRRTLSMIDGVAIALNGMWHSCCLSFYPG